MLDATFGDDQSRLRKGHGAKNMATVRHFALNLVRAAKDKHCIRLRRKLATWTPAYLEQLLNADAKQPGFEALREHPREPAYPGTRGLRKELVCNQTAAGP